MYHLTPLKQTPVALFSCVSTHRTE